MRDNFISSPTILVKFVSIRQRNFHQHAVHVFPSKFRESKKLQNFIIVKLRYHVLHFLSTFFIKTCVYSEPSAESNLSEKKTQTFEIIIIRNLYSKNLKKIPTNHFSNRIKTSKGILQNFATHGPIPVIIYRPDRLHFPWYLGIRSTERYRETREETALPVFRCSRNIPRSNSYIGGERERGQANGSRRDTVIYAIPVAGRCVSTVCARV